MIRRIVVVGASAGGVEALIALAKGLPPDLGVPIAVVLHVSPAVPSYLPAILARSGPLDARHARDGEAPEPGRIYVAPPDMHMLVETDGFRVVREPRENGHRPAIDPLFRSAARSYGPGVIAVVLSGTRNDGAAGVREVATRGGAVVVQDPADAAHGSMPTHAILADNPDDIVPAAQLAAAVAFHVAGPLTGLAERQAQG
jgi:two-component system chemotaxis response regulator CheB